MTLEIVRFIAQFLAVVLIITLHEWAHAYAAYKCGDPTAKFSGRMTLNPVKHFDPLGILVFALSGFGWAKPVPVNPNNFRNYRKGSLITSSAGVVMNYLTAFLFYPLFYLVVLYVCPKIAGTYAEEFIFRLFGFLFWASISFSIFNLLPFYPLDGFRIVDSLSTRRGKVYRFLRQYGWYILMGLILINIAEQRVPMLHYVNVLGYFMDYAVTFISKPITLFWNWIFGLIL